MSAAAESQSARSPVSAPVPFGKNAPSVALPLMFVLTGVAALLTAVAWMLTRPSLLVGYHYNQYAIAITHLVVLGWGCSIVMGAVYQLVPVALETRLHSDRLARVQFVFHLVGVVGMVWMFYKWNMEQVGHFGSVFAVGVSLFVYNIARTLRRAPRWNVTGTAVAAALAWISLAILAGLSITTAKCTYGPVSESSAVAPLLRGLRLVAGALSHFDAISTMHAHAHLGGVGCFILLIVGVSYKLVPMFTLSEVQCRRRAAWSVVLLNVGLAGSFVTILLQSPWKLAFAFVVCTSLLLYGCEVRAILRARRRRALDWGIKYFLSAIALLLPLAGLAVALAWPGLPLNPLTGKLENAYGFLGLMGVVTPAIIGMLYKIVPFLVWFGRYSRQIGRARVPALTDLYSTRLQCVGYWSYLTGIAIATIATLAADQTVARVGGALLAVGVLTLAVNVGLMLSHFFKPRLKPFVIPNSTVPKPA